MFHQPKVEARNNKKSRERERERESIHFFKRMLKDIVSNAKLSQSCFVIEYYICLYDYQKKKKKLYSYILFL